MGRERERKEKESVKENDIACSLCDVIHKISLVVESWVTKSLLLIVKKEKLNYYVTYLTFNV